MHQADPGDSGVKGLVKGVGDLRIAEVVYVSRCFHLFSCVLPARLKTKSFKKDVAGWVNENKVKDMKKFIGARDFNAVIKR